ncbi:MAG: hypothetical protein ACM3IJ_03375 [Candidatus Levyibacteriota bacterium]
MANKSWKQINHQSGGSAVYGMGLVGALIYYLQHSHTLTEGLFGILKAVLWPGFLLYRILELLKM